MHKLAQVVHSLTHTIRLESDGREIGIIRCMWDVKHWIFAIKLACLVVIVLVVWLWLCMLLWLLVVSFEHFNALSSWRLRHHLYHVVGGCGCICSCGCWFGCGCACGCWLLMSSSIPRCSSWMEAAQLSVSCHCCWLIFKVVLLLVVGCGWLGCGYGCWLFMSSSIPRRSSLGGCATIWRCFTKIPDGRTAPAGIFFKPLWCIFDLYNVVDMKLYLYL